MRNIFNKFSLVDQIYFTQKLSILLDSNLSLIDSLKIIKSMEEKEFKINIYNSLIRDCENGISLSKSILNLSVKFDPFLITLIKNGEQTGSLVLSLSQISKSLEKRNDTKKKIISTLIYPIFIFVATIFMAIFLVMYIFPKIMPLLSSLNIKLPFLTRLVKFLYEFGVSKGLYLIFFILIISFVLRFTYKRYYKFKLICHKFVLKIPIISNYLILNINCILCSIGEILLNSNRSLSDFHIFNRDTFSNIAYKNIFNDIYQESIIGISFTQSISKYPKFFNKIMINMCDIGERSGNLSEMMGHCNRIFEQDMDLLLKRFSSLIEPVLMIFMGLIVGSIALSIILPVYEITNHLSK